MAEKIVINPLTRISGFMEIRAEIQGNVVTDAKTDGLMLRGFEYMLRGRHPLDAIFFTERICGICSTAHSVASSCALEDAMGIRVPEQGRYVRDVIHCCEFLQNHIRHFYQFTAPDFVRMPEKFALFDTANNDFRLPGEVNGRIVANYFESLQMSRAAHEMLAILGGKAPHNHGVFVGGAVSAADADAIIRLKALLSKIHTFVLTRMIDDASDIARYYPEYFRLGAGHGNLLTYGLFYGYRELGTLYVDPLFHQGGKTGTFDPQNISENIEYSWYRGPDTYAPFEAMPEPDYGKKDAFSFIRAARYGGLPFEVGPLARQWLSGEYKNGISAMDRTIARVMEAKKICEVLDILLSQIDPALPSLQKEWEIPSSAQGAGLTDTTRGALGHWLKIEDQKISFYQIITPSVWNLSPQTKNMKGTAEAAIIGTPLRDVKNPVAIGAIVRTFDPCVSCATHVYAGEEYIKTIRVVP